MRIFLIFFFLVFHFPWLCIAILDLCILWTIASPNISRNRNFEPLFAPVESFDTWFAFDLSWSARGDAFLDCDSNFETIRNCFMESWSTMYEICFYLQKIHRCMGNNLRSSNIRLRCPVLIQFLGYNSKFKSKEVISLILIIEIIRIRKLIVEFSNVRYLRFLLHRNLELFAFYMLLRFIQTRKHLLKFTADLHLSILAFSGTNIVTSKSSSLENTKS